MTEASLRLTTALSRSYRIEREFGQGGMATVYLAEDLKHQRKVAVKVLRTRESVGRPDGLDFSYAALPP